MDWHCKSKAGKTEGVSGKTKEIFELIFKGKYSEGNEMTRFFTPFDARNDGIFDNRQLDDTHMEERLLVSPNRNAEDEDA